MGKKIWLILLLVGLGIVAVIFLRNRKILPKMSQRKEVQKLLKEIVPPHSLSIAALRRQTYKGSEIQIEETLSPGSNYQRYLVSYQSEGLKIYAYLTVPNGKKPAAGWPVVVFNHGYIPPEEYRSTERYVAYTDGFSRNGYVLLRPDYRGNGISEGEPESAYGSNAYTIDVLNAVASIKKYPGVNPKRIGMWGHSMGGHIALRSMVTTKDIKVGVIWAGVVASYSDLFYNWRRSLPFRPTLPPSHLGWRQLMTAEYGEPVDNPEFWNSLSATNFLDDLSGPIQLHHGTADESVPHEFSQNLAKKLKEHKQPHELYLYSGDDHNLAQNFNLAMERSVNFFDKYLK